MSAISSSFDRRKSIALTDLAGHRFHMVATGLALSIAPLGIAGGEVALAILMVVSIARWRDLGPVWAEAFRAPVGWALGLLLAWIGLSLLWSSDPRNGLDRIQCMRALLWAPLLYPLMRDVKSRTTLLLWLLAGITVLASTQVWQWTSFVLMKGLAASDLQRFGGLHGEVGKAGLWSAAGVCIGAFLCTSPRLTRKTRIAVSIAALCCLGGVCACATLRAMGGATIGLLACCLFSVTCSLGAARGTLRQRAWVALPVAVAIAGFWIGAERRLPWGVIRAESSAASPTAKGKSPAANVAPPHADGTIHRAGATSTPASTGPRAGALSRLLSMDSVAPRILWWRACWHAFIQRPVVGWGWGATPTIVSQYPEAANFVASHPRIVASHPTLLTTTQPHSAYFMSLGELGAVGFALTLSIVLLVLIDAARAVKACGELGGPAAATIMWLVAAGGDTVFNAAVFAAGAIFMAFAATVAHDGDSRALSPEDR